MNQIQSILSAIVTLAVACAAYCGHTLQPDLLWNLGCVILFIAAFIWGIYKNHNFTSAAETAQGYLKWLKGKTETEDDLKDYEAIHVAHGDNRD